jgi:D-sedoheptulose 7-phosphate isomerase
MHMAADLRKLCNIDAVAPDNMAELTAWANDEGWAFMFDGYLANMNKQDALFVLSVGGGTHDVSRPLSFAVELANSRMTPVFGIVGPTGGKTADLGNHIIRIPVTNPKHVTPHTEAFQAVIWHCLVSHPLLQKRPTKW